MQSLGTAKLQIAPHDIDGVLGAAAPGHRDALGGAARHIGPVGRHDIRREAMGPIPGNVIRCRCSGHRSTRPAAQRPSPVRHLAHCRSPRLPARRLPHRFCGDAGKGDAGKNGGRRAGTPNARENAPEQPRPGTLRPTPRPPRWRQARALLRRQTRQAPYTFYATWYAPLRWLQSSTPQSDARPGLSRPQTYN